MAQFFPRSGDTATVKFTRICFKPYCRSWELYAIAVWPSERTIALIFELGFGSSIGAAEVQDIPPPADSER